MRRGQRAIPRQQQILKQQMAADAKPDNNRRSCGVLHPWHPVSTAGGGMAMGYARLEPAQNIGAQFFWSVQLRELADPAGVLLQKAEHLAHERILIGKAIHRGTVARVQFAVNVPVMRN